MSWGEDPEQLWAELGSVLDATDQVRLASLQAQIDVLEGGRG